MEKREAAWKKLCANWLSDLDLLGARKIYKALTEFKPLPDDTISVLSKLNAFADVDFIVAHIVHFLFDRNENIAKTGETVTIVW